MPKAFYLLFLLHTPQVETCGYKVGHGYAFWVLYHILYYCKVIITEKAFYRLVFDCEKLFEKRLNL